MTPPGRGRTGSKSGNPGRGPGRSLVHASNVEKVLGGLSRSQFEGENVRTKN